MQSQDSPTWYQPCQEWAHYFHPQICTLSYFPEWYQLPSNPEIIAFNLWKHAVFRIYFFTPKTQVDHRRPQDRWGSKGGRKCIPFSCPHRHLPLFPTESRLCLSILRSIEPLSVCQGWWWLFDNLEETSPLSQQFTGQLITVHFGTQYTKKLALRVSIVVIQRISDK